MKLLLITNIPNPYRIPLFNLLQKRLAEEKSELFVLFGAFGYNRRRFSLNIEDFKFKYKILNSLKLRLFHSEGLLFTYPGILRIIISYKPDKIIVSGFSVASFKLFIYSLVFNIKYIIWSGSIFGQDRFDSSLRIYLRKLILKRAYAFISYGSQAKKYLIELGVNPEKINIGINTVDTIFFKLESDKIRNKLIRYNLIHNLTYIGYLNKRKNVGKLIQICSQLKNKRNDFILHIVGDGEEIIYLKTLTENLKLSENVIFHGFKQKNELPQFYAVCDLFLFQTDFDIWGLVLNEAMAAGCCCLASKNAGATYDLIKDDHTGFIVDFKEIEKTSQLIHNLLNNKKLSNEIGNNASKFISEKVSLQNTVDGFLGVIL
jgi:glycosyltransferase involved in cell wall biosynthesis